METFKKSNNIRWWDEYFDAFFTRNEEEEKNWKSFTVWEEIMSCSFAADDDDLVKSGKNEKIYERSKVA